MHKHYLCKVFMKLVSAIFFSMYKLMSIWVHGYPCMCRSEGNPRCHYSNFIPFVFWHRVLYWPVTHPIGQTVGPESQRSTRSLLPRFGLRALLTMLLRFFFKWILRMQLGFPGCRSALSWWTYILWLFQSRLFSFLTGLRIWREAWFHGLWVLDECSELSRDEARGSRSFWVVGVRSNFKLFPILHGRLSIST